MRLLVLAFIFMVLSVGLGTSGCERRLEAVSTPVGHVVPKADGTLPKTHFLTAPFGTVEVDNQRSTTYLMSTMAFLVAAVAVFLALQVPVLTKSMWSLAVTALLYGVFAATYATYYTYIVCGFFILMCLAVLVGLILIAKHVIAAKTATDLADDLEKFVPESSAAWWKERAAKAQAAHGVTKLIKRIRGK